MLSHVAHSFVVFTIGRGSVARVPGCATSTFGYESFTLLTTGNWLGAGLYLGASVLGGPLAVFLGAGLVRLITG